PRRLCRRRQRRTPVSVGFVAGGSGTRSTCAPSGALRLSRSPTAAGPLPPARPRRVRSRALAARRSGPAGADPRETGPIGVRLGWFVVPEPPLVGRRLGVIVGRVHRGLLSRVEFQGDCPGVIAASKTRRAPETGGSAGIAGTRAAIRRREGDRPDAFRRPLVSVLAMSANSNLAPG